MTLSAEAELRAFTRRSRRVTALDIEIARSIFSFSSNKLHIKQALALISRRDLYQLVEGYVKPIPPKDLMVNFIFTGPLSWRPLNFRPGEKQESPVSTSAYPLAVEELISVVKATFSGRAKSIKKQSLISDLKHAAHITSMIGNSITRFVLRKFRVFYRFGRFSLLFSLIQLLGGLIINPKYDLIGNIPEIVASLVGMLSSPNLLQSGNSEKRKFLRRAVARLLNQALLKIGHPHGEALTLQIARQLFPLAEKVSSCQIGYFLEISGLHLR